MTRRDSRLARRRSRAIIEGVATGIAFGAGLICVGALLVASFHPSHLGMPYWNRVPRLRTDTCGAAAFVVVAITLVVSEYFRLRRTGSPQQDTSEVARQRPLTDFAKAVARVVALLATVLVVYLSVNAVTHPHTLAIHATRFVSWPTESTLRVVALLVCVVSVGWLRYVAARRVV